VGRPRMSADRDKPTPWPLPHNPLHALDFAVRREGRFWRCVAPALPRRRPHLRRQRIDHRARVDGLLQPPDPGDHGRHRLLAITGDDHAGHAGGRELLGEAEGGLAAQVHVQHGAVQAAFAGFGFGLGQGADRTDRNRPGGAQRLGEIVGEQIFVFGDEDARASERGGGRALAVPVSISSRKPNGSRGHPFHVGNGAAPRSLGRAEADAMAKKDIIVIGGSAGSSAVLRRIMRDLPGDLPASLFVATHMPTHAPAHLVDILANAGPLPVSRALDGQPVEQGHVYVAAPDRHMLLVEGTIRLGDGPRENMARPAIDPLFRSAALFYGPRAVGAVLTGMLNDGASGLAAIKACGGTAVVQHPLDAEVDQMPRAALETVLADEVAPAAELGALLARLAGTDAGEGFPPPPGLALEVEIAAGARLGAAALRKIADPSALSCPECQGVLSEMRDERPLRYRCQIGHAQTAEVLAARTEEVDEAMRIALRVMEERVTLVTRMAQDARATGRKAVAELYEARAEEYGRYAEILRTAAIRAMRVGSDDVDQKT